MHPALLLCSHPPQPSDKSCFFFFLSKLTLLVQTGWEPAPSVTHPTRPLLSPVICNLPFLDPRHTLNVKTRTTVCFGDNEAEVHRTYDWFEGIQSQLRIPGSSSAPSTTLPYHGPEALAQVASVQASLPMVCGDFLPVTVADRISKWLLSSLALSLICMVTTRSAMTASKPTTVVYSSIGYTKRPGGAGAQRHRVLNPTQHTPLPEEGQPWICPGCTWICGLHSLPPRGQSSPGLGPGR